MHYRFITNMIRRVLCIVLGCAFAVPAAWALNSLGLPEVAEPSVGKVVEVEKLGERLFNDKRLSARGDTSCATCHIAERQFSDGRKTAQTPNGPTLVRNTPSLLNVRFLSTLFWDGRVSTLAEQALFPLTNPAEHGLASAEAVLAIVRRDHTYLAAFYRAMGVRTSEVTIRQVTQALATYEGTLVAGDSPFDRFRYGGDRNAMSEAAVRGMALFQGRAQCASCHTIGADSALFTDQDFHVTPLGLPKSSTERLGELTRRVDDLSKRGSTSELNVLIETDPDISALGRFVVTRDPRDIGLFKTPSLRNVALTAPYMHDGSVASLPKAIELELYSRNSQRSPLVLSEDERADLLQFLLALTSN
jgi:cytochrome c peroxidase